MIPQDSCSLWGSIDLTIWKSTDILGDWREWQRGWKGLCVKTLSVELTRRHHWKHCLNKWKANQLSVGTYCVHGLVYRIPPWSIFYRLFFWRGGGGRQPLLAGRQTTFPVTPSRLRLSPTVEPSSTVVSLEWVDVQPAIGTKVSDYILQHKKVDEYTDTDLYTGE